MPPRRASARHAAQPKSAAALPSSATTPGQSRKSTRRGKPAIAADEPVVGRTAALEVWETLDIRHMILTLLDRRTLFGMMALEKNGVLSIADIVYKSINIANLKKFTRKNPRSPLYCGAVQILEICPLPEICRKFKLENPPPPVLLDPETLLSNITAWQAIFPRLNTILNEFPTGELDDACVVRLRDGNISVDLHTTVNFPVHYMLFPKATGPILPPVPSHNGMTFHHTLGVSTMFHDSTFTHVGNSAESYESYDSWGRYLLQTPELDRRITANDFQDYSEMEGDELVNKIATITQRKSDGCEPWSDFVFPFDLTPLSFARFREVTTLLGPGLRKLEFHAPVLRRASDLRAVMLILDSALPQLQVLDIKFQLGRTPWEHPEEGTTMSTIAKLKPPLPGLANLRELSVQFVFHSYAQDPRVLALYLAPLGAASCIYRNVNLRNNEYKKAFHSLVKQAQLDSYSISNPARVRKPNVLEVLGDDYKSALKSR